MKIHSFKIKNFKHIIEANVKDLEHKRVILFQGDNGHGKSSLMTSFSYGFTGILPDRTKTEDYIHWGCAKNFNLEYVFSHEAKLFDYKISGGKTTTRDLLIDNKESYSNSGATNYLAKLFDPTITNYSVMSEQGQSSALLLDRPAERLKKFKKILKVEEVGEIVETIKKDISGLERQIEVLQSNLKIYQAKEFKYLEVPEKPKQNINYMIEELAGLKRLKSDYENKLKDYEKYLESLNIYKAAQFQIQKNNEHLKDYKEKKSKLGNYLPTNFDEESLNIAKQNLHEFEKIKIQHDNDYKKYKEALDKENKVISERVDLETKILKYPEKRIKPKTYTDQDEVILEANIIDCKGDINYLKNKINLVEQGKCPTCGQICEGNKEELELTLKRVEVSLEEYEKNLRELKRDKSKYESEVKEQEINSVQRENIQKRINFLIDEQNQLAEIKCPPPLEDLSKVLLPQIKKLTEEKEKHLAVLEYNQLLQKENTEIDLKINSIESKNEELLKVVEPEKITKPTFNFEYFEELNNSILLYNQKMEEIERVEKINKEIKEEEKQNFKLSEETEVSILEYRKQINIKNETKETLDKQFSSWLINNGAKYIQDKMNSFFNRSYGRYDITFAQDKGSVDFFYLDPKVKVIKPVVMAGGFEKQVIAIGNRVALDSLQNIGVMFLDEVDDAGKSEMSVKLFETLFEESSINQFFIVSHCEATQEMIKNRQDSIIFNIHNGRMERVF